MNKRYVVVGLLVLLLLFSSFAIGLGSGGANGNAIKINEGGVRGYSTHDMIRINNDTDFANQASQESWPGNGTESNPYVISGYDIDAHLGKDSIYIGNTTVHFIIENCYLHNASYDGISFHNVSNGTVENNNCSDNLDGDVYLYYSRNSTIKNNSCISKGAYGVHLYYSNHNKIINNTCRDNFNGIALSNSLGNIIDNNTCMNSDWEGIYLWYSSKDNVVINNTLLNNSDDGISVFSSSSSNIMNNNTIINNGWYGIEVYSSCSNNIIENNTISHNKLGGIIIGEEGYSGSNDYNKLKYNFIYENEGYGINVYLGSHNLIFSNIFYHNYGSNNTFNYSHIQACDNGTNNSWSSATGIGNYWADWANNNNTNDQNHDGRVDWPYKIDGSAGTKDYYSLKCPPFGDFSPSAPYNLIATAGVEYVNLTWSKSECNGTSSITQYNIYRNSALVGIVPANQLWFNDTNVVNGQTYTYYVTAVNSVGESEKSNEVQATPSGAVPEFSTGIWLFIVVLISLLGVARFRKSS